MDNKITKLLDELQREVKLVQNQNAEFDTVKSIIEGKSKLGLYRCVLDDCEVTIVEYKLATSTEEANKMFGWESYDPKIECILDADQFKCLLETLSIRTVDEDMD